MAIVFEISPPSGSVRSRRYPALSLLLRRQARRIVDAWQARRAERELEALPFDLRKDIGFRAMENDRP